jgi:hypothetical protein
MPRFALDFKNLADYMVKKYHNGDYKTYLGQSPQPNNQLNVEAEAPDQAVLAYNKPEYLEAEYYAMDMESEKIYWVKIDHEAQTAKVVRYYV